MPNAKFAEQALDALDQGFRVLASAMNEVLAYHRTGIAIEVYDCLPSDSLPSARIKLRDALHHLPALELPVDANRVFPWTLGFLGGRSNREWLIPLADDDIHVHLFASLRNASFADRSFSFWKEHVVKVCETHQRSWENSLKRFLGPTELLNKLQNKPALMRIYDLLADGEWHETSSKDERNYQRLSDLIIGFEMEIERPRGERRIRIKSSTLN
jgi:hypothetical protein